LVSSGKNTDKIKIWDLNDFTCMSTHTSPQSSITRITISPDDQYLASCSEDGDIYLWGSQDMKLLDQICAHEHGANMIEFSRDGKRLVSCGDDCKIMIWRMNGVKNLLLEKIFSNGFKNCFRGAIIDNVKGIQLEMVYKNFN